MVDSESTTTVSLSVSSQNVLPKQSGKKDKKTRKNFRWEEELIGNLISCLLDYKINMSFQCKDFDADKPKLYTEIRNSLAKLHPEVFGPEKELCFQITFRKKK